MDLATLIWIISVTLSEISPSSRAILRATYSRRRSSRKLRSGLGTAWISARAWLARRFASASRLAASIAGASIYASTTSMPTDLAKSLISSV